MGTKANPSKFDCYDRAAPDEPVFALTGRDLDGPATVEFWAQLRQAAISAGLKPQEDEAKVLEARRTATQMREWKERHPDTNEAPASLTLLPYLTPAIPREGFILLHSVRTLVGACHGQAFAAGWWPTNPKDRNVGEALMLCVSELAEGMEGFRKGLKDDHLPEFDMIEVELADALIRIFDLAGGRNWRVGDALVAKLRYNAQRADHKPEVRAAEGGKKF